jgi:hypothetical protein
MADNADFVCVVGWGWGFVAMIDIYAYLHETFFA